MAGAAILSGLGALRAGAGLLTVGVVEKERRTVTTRLPEAMTLSLPESKTGCISFAAIEIIKNYVRRRTITALAIGPGLSTHAAVRKVIKSLLSFPLPIVLDADGLNNIRAGELIGSQAVITPHPGELARLLGVTRRQIEKDRPGIAQKTARKLGIVCVLKGNRTVISDGDITFINPTGNQAMATGGMGDVLTGVIAGLLAQGLDIFEAACAGVYLHGLAGDLARVSDRGLLASDVAAHVPDALKQIGIR